VECRFHATVLPLRQKAEGRRAAGRIKGDNVRDASASALGTVIRALRHEHGLNQVELAKRLGKPSATVSAWELGKAMPEAANLVAVANALETTVSNLLVRSGLQEDPGTGRPRVPSGDSSGLREAKQERVSERIPCFGLEEFSVNADGGWFGEAEGEILRSGDNSDPHSYALRIRGNALYPRFWEGDTVEVVTDIAVRDGDLAVVLHRDGRKWIRRVAINRRRNTVRCEPLNPSDRLLEFPLTKVSLHLVLSVKPNGDFRQQRSRVLPA
jgi:transcriptional regulator with XRE-family HTH domain